MKPEKEKYAEQFADYMIEAMARTRMRQTEIARLAGLSRTTISQIVGKKPNSTTGKMILPERETVDRIAKAFGDPVWQARRAAGYAGGEEEGKQKTNRDTERQAQAARMAKLIQNWNSLPLEKQDELIAISEIMQPKHPQLFNAPIEIAGSPEDLTDDAEIEDTGNSPP